MLRNGGVTPATGATHANSQGLPATDNDDTWVDVYTIRKQLEEAAGIRNIAYTLHKPGKVTAPGFQIPVGITWETFRSTLLGDFKIDPALHDSADFLFSLASAPNSWVSIDSERIWCGSALEAIFVNHLDREAEQMGEGVPIGRKKTVKEALPLNIKVVSPSLVLIHLLTSQLLSRTLKAL